MDSPDPVPLARALFEAYRRGDEAAMLACAHADVGVVRVGGEVVGGHVGISAMFAEQRGAGALVEATPHAYERVGPCDVLVSGRLRVLDRGLRDAPAWWLLRFRDGLWASSHTFASEADARMALALPVAA